MKITISHPFAPFSHKLGACCFLPGTNIIVQTTPQSIRIGEFELPYETASLPVTLQQDLERNCVFAFSRSFRYRIQTAKEGIVVSGMGQKKIFPLEEEICFPDHIERLHLGVSKAQDVELMERRRHLPEILPVTFMQGQKIPSMHANFTSIRALFFEEKENAYFVLPHLIFSYGRLLNLKTQIGSLDIEWAKRRLRRAVFRCAQDAEFFLRVEGLSSMRSKLESRNKGISHSLQNPFPVQKGKTYLLDQFR